MRTLPSLTEVVFALVLLATGTTALAADSDRQKQPAGPTNAQVEQLQRQIQTMQEQLDGLRAGQASSQQEAIRQHWQSMQDYMRNMQSMPGMTRGPMMGPGMMRGPSARNDWMMGCPMMGGTGGAWPVPQGMDAQQYRTQMLQHMERMRSQMARIGSTTDPAERQRLAREHWDEMYRNMQSMRGMGWMWATMPGGERGQSLPEPTSAGAKLVTTYCTQCHAAPSPSLHTAAEWSVVTERMSSNMKSLSQGSPNAVKLPNDAERKAILTYLQKHAR